MIDKIRENLLFKIFKKDSFFGKLIDKFFTKEIVTYIIFGILTTLVNWCTYTLFVHFLKVNITISNAVAWIVGVIFAYITNKIWVFESRSFKAGVILKEFISFVAARAVTGVLEIFGVPLLVKAGLNQTIFGVEGAVSKVLVSIVVIILNYVFSKLIVFKKEKSNEEKQNGKTS